MNTDAAKTAAARLRPLGFRTVVNRSVGENAVEVGIELHGLHGFVIIREEDDTEEMVNALARRLIAGLVQFAANSFEPEVFGPTKEFFDADRSAWLAKIKGQPAPEVDWDALASKRVAWVDRAKGTWGEEYVLPVGPRNRDGDS